VALSVALHPKAYVRIVKNVRPGLESRTKILLALERELLTAREIAEKVGMSYGAVLEQLRNLERDGVVERVGKRPYRWRLTGLGQQSISDFVSA